MGNGRGSGRLVFEKVPAEGEKHRSGHGSIWLTNAMKGTPGSDDGSESLACKEWVVSSSCLVLVNHCLQWRLNHVVFIFVANG